MYDIWRDDHTGKVFFRIEYEDKCQHTEDVKYDELQRMHYGMPKDHFDRKQSELFEKAKILHKNGYPRSRVVWYDFVLLDEEENVTHGIKRETGCLLKNLDLNELYCGYLYVFVNKDFMCNGKSVPFLGESLFYFAGFDFVTVVFVRHYLRYLER